MLRKNLIRLRNVHRLTGVSLSDVSIFGDANGFMLGKSIRRNASKVRIAPAGAKVFILDCAPVQGVAIPQFVISHTPVL